MCIRNAQSSARVLTGSKLRECHTFGIILPSLVHIPHARSFTFFLGLLIFIIKYNWGWNFKELLRNNLRFTWGSFHGSNCKKILNWGAWPDFFSMSLLFVYHRGQPQATGPQVTYTQKDLSFCLCTQALGRVKRGCHRCNWHPWCSLSFKYLLEFCRKKLKEQ